MRYLRLKWENFYQNQNVISWFSFIKNEISEKNRLDIHRNLSNCMCCKKHRPINKTPHNKCYPIWSGYSSNFRTTSLDHRFKRHGKLCTCPCNHYRVILDLVSFT